MVFTFKEMKNNQVLVMEITGKGEKALKAWEFDVSLP